MYLIVIGTILASVGIGCRYEPSDGIIFAGIILLCVGSATGMIKYLDKD